MRDRDPPIHAFVVAPETLEWVHALRVRYRNDRNKEEKCAENPRAARTIYRIDEREGEPRARDQFDEKAEGEILARDVRKEELV